MSFPSEERKKVRTVCSSLDKSTWINTNHFDITHEMCWQLLHDDKAVQTIHCSAHTYQTYQHKKQQFHSCEHRVNFSSFMDTLKPQSNRPLYINAVIGILATDGWAVTFGTARRDLAGCGPVAPPSPLLAVPNVTAHPSTASVPT